MAPMWTERQQFWFNVWAYTLTGLVFAATFLLLYGTAIGVMALWTISLG